MELKRRESFLIFVGFVSLILILLGSIFSAVHQDKKLPYLLSSEYEDLLIRPIVKEDGLYFFIPSDMDTEDLFLRSEKTIYCDDRIVNNAAITPFFEGEHSYKIAGQDTAIYFYQSENVPSLFIDTVRKDMDFVNDDKTNETEVRIRSYSKQGEKILSMYPISIKGRGNNSFKTEKKSYTLTFDEDCDVLSMGAAGKWILVPSSSDTTLINNMVVSRFAKETGLYWTPDCEYADVYFDGEYGGLYLVYEKPQISDERLAIGKDGVLLKRELSSRLEIVDNGFLTEKGNVIEISDPKAVSSLHKQQIVRKVQAMEDALFDLNSDDWKQVIDIDSWARCYLIDELFDNLDAGIASAYFYIGEDGKFYRGPVWDYDTLMWDPARSMIADTYQREPYSVNDYYYLLNKREEFLTRVREIYEEEYRPLIISFVTEKIDAISVSIDAARAMDGARWDHHFSQSSVMLFKEYLKNKAEFMEEYWDHKENFCKILVQKDFFYLTYITEKGSSIAKAYDIDLSLLKQSEYHYADTLDPVDLDAPVYEDQILVNETFDIAEEQSSDVGGLGLLNMAFLALFGFLFLILGIAKIIER